MWGHLEAMCFFPLLLHVIIFLITAGSWVDSEAQGATPGPAMAILSAVRWIDSICSERGCPSKLTQSKIACSVWADSLILK